MPAHLRIFCVQGRSVYGFWTARAAEEAEAYRLSAFVFAPQSGDKIKWTLREFQCGLRSVVCSLPCR
jgi:hypothetical protein